MTLGFSKNTINLLFCRRISKQVAKYFLLREMECHRDREENHSWNAVHLINFCTCINPNGAWFIFVGSCLGFKIISYKDSLTNRAEVI